MQLDIRNISDRLLYLAGALFVSGLMATGFYLQYVLRQEPCPLCMVQRMIFVAMLMLFAVAALHGPGRFGKRVYAVLTVLLSLMGVAVAARHIWLQNLPRDQVPACGPGLNYMLETFPMAEVLQELLQGSGECAARGWSFLTLGIPEWSLLCYILLGIWAVLIAVKKAA